MSNKAGSFRSGRAGFTLIETLAALAIASVIILSTGALIHQGAFFFDHGTQVVGEVEQLTAAIECLTRDFGAAHFILERTPGAVHAAFIASPASADGPEKVLFVTSGARALQSQGDELVGITVEAADGVTKLVRRRAPWQGLATPIADAGLKDPVILLKGKLKIAFTFSELTSNGAIVWHNQWTGEKGLPHSVRMSLRDDGSGAELMRPVDFPIYVDAPASCANGKVECLSLSSPANSGSEQNAGDAIDSRAARQ